jgi:NAD(P)H-hydrate epimerase
VAEQVLARIEAPADHKVVILCGTGNNGGDGLVAAHRLAEAGAQVAVYCVRPPDESDPKVQRLRERGLLVVEAESDQRWRVLKNLLRGATVVVDAVLGTGARLPVAGAQADLLRQAGKVLAERTTDTPLRVAVDVPSGLDSDTGELDPVTLPADVTVTFAAAKHGQLRFPAAEAVGDLVIADIGIADDLPELGEVKAVLATPELVRERLPKRPRDAHKGTFGRTLIVAGSVNFTGAAYLAGAAAYRVGAGLVTLAVPSAIYPVLAVQLPEATWVLLPNEMGVLSGPAAEQVRREAEASQSLLVGPGFGQEKETAAFMSRWLGADEPAAARRGQLGFVAPSRSGPAEQPARASVPPLVVDADGLKLLAGVEGWAERLPRNSILTPHPGEMAVLTGMDKAAIQADRLGTARDWAERWSHVVVLKGAYTVVAAPDGRCTIEPFATAALARAGTGDVLAGAIAGLLAQGMEAYDAAVAGAYIHGLAGMLAAQALGNTASVMAGDVLEALAEALNDVLAEG